MQGQAQGRAGGEMISNDTSLVMCELISAHLEYITFLLKTIMYIALFNSAVNWCAKFKGMK